MKLFHAFASPYVRKVMITAHELGLVDQLELVQHATTPVDANPEVIAANPLARIPALQLDDGSVLMDSRVICRYLNHIGGGSLYGSGDAEFPIIAREAMAEGALDSSLFVIYEGRLRPEEKHHAPLLDGHMGKVTRALGAFDARIDEMSGDLTIDKIALGALCGYLNFRMPDLGWQTDNPALADWFAAFEGRPSMQATIPQG
ncbi:MAG: glutathione S-transferase [Pseudomonadota bacterium]